SLRVPLGSPDPPGVLEPTHQLLLLGVYRDGWLVPLQLSLDDLVDVFELRISIGMASSLQRLPVGLETVFQVMQKSRHQGVTDLIALRVQLLGQVSRALAGPAQRRLRVPSRHRLHQLFQGRRESGHAPRRALPSSPRTPDPRWAQRLLLSQLHQPANNRVAGQASRAGNDRNSTPPKSPGFRTCPQTPVALVHGRQQRAEFCSDLLIGSHIMRVGRDDTLVKLFRYNSLARQDRATVMRRCSAARAALVCSLKLVSLSA